MSRMPLFSSVAFSLTVLVQAIGPCAAEADEQQRPNIILIMADDIGQECYGFSGSTQYRTPMLDRMAAEGMRFTQCHAQPLCTPSRVKLMTGVSNVRNYSAFSVLNPDLTTIGQHFRQGGYRTAVAGKWQLLGARHYKAQFRGKGSWPEDCGFERSCLWQVDDLGDRYWHPTLRIDGENRTFSTDDYGPDIVNQFVLDFMEEHQEEPFFVYYPMILVHDPFLPTPDSEDRNSRNRGRNFEDMVAYMDKLIGRVTEQARRLNMAERTLVLYCGDNGTHKSIRSELHGRVIQGGKGSTTDNGTHVALLAWQPGTIAAGSGCADLTDHSDFLPTCLDAAGLPIPTDLDGRSFLPQLQGRPGHPRQWLYCYYNPRPEKTTPRRFARDTHFKLYGNGRLYDLRQDPDEKTPLPQSDLRESSEISEARRKLRAAIDSFPQEGQCLLQFAEKRTED